LRRRRKNRLKFESLISGGGGFEQIIKKFNLISGGGGFKPVEVSKFSFRRRRIQTVYLKSYVYFRRRRIQTGYLKNYLISGGGGFKRVI
jgi:hypothetical protein